MPTKRTPISRTPVQLDPADWAFLIDQDHRCRLRGVDDDALWAQWRDLVLDYWVQEHPGTRPSLWWKFDAPRMPAGTLQCAGGRMWPHELPEPRRRLGGRGTPCYEVLSYWPNFTKGVPSDWVTSWQVEYYNGRAKDVHGQPIGTEYRPGDFTGVAIDPDDPPRFETELEYLRRHGLLLPGEG